MPESEKPASILQDRISKRLADIDARGLRRNLRPPLGIDLSSNDYLGLARHPRVVEAMAKAVLREGAGSTGSRLLRGERDCFTHLEQRFARFKGAERSLYFSSGFLANLAVLTTFAEEGDVVYSDELNHASLIDGARLSKATRVIFPHNDVEALRRLMDARTQEKHGAAAKYVVVESIFSMDGDDAPLAAYVELCRSTGAALIVDEAHAVGIYGARGSGRMEALGVSDDVFASINTAGKALGVSGAFVCGSEWAIEYLIQRARPFLFSTAAPPAVAAAIESALDVIEEEPGRRQRVLVRARQLRDRLRMDGCSQIVPVMIGDNARAVAVAHHLQDAGFDVRAVRPPTVPDGTARLRVSLNEGLTEATLNQFADALGNSAPHPMSGVLRGLFITGTDTNVGKTVTSAAVFHRYNKEAQLRYWKPIQTGFERGAEPAVNSGIDTGDDTQEVQRLGALSQADVLDEGIRYRDPVSPHLAAERLGDVIGLERLRMLLPLAAGTAWIVEGAGGVLVPVNDANTMRDFIRLVGLPVLIAARSTLGTINHTLLTIEALRSRELPVTGVVMIGPPDDDNRKAVEHYGNVPVLGQMPKFDPLTPKALGDWARAHLDRDGILKPYLVKSHLAGLST